MSRAAIHKDEFTPFGLWIKEYVDSYMTVTNIDYFCLKVIGNNVNTMLVEEKTNNGICTSAQKMALRFLNDQLKSNDGKEYNFNMFGNKKIVYWGFYLLRMPKNKTMPGPGMTLNDLQITSEQLADHMGFKNKFCAGMFI